MPVFLEMPASEVSDTVMDVYGWVATDTNAPEISVHANGRRVRHILHDRPDVRRLLTGFDFVAGVHAPLSVADLDACDAAEIELSCDGERIGKRCVLLPTALQAHACEETLRRAARDRCLAALVCPTCRNPGLNVAPRQRAVCSACGEAFSQFAGALNMIADRRQLDCRTSAIGLPGDPYPPEALALIGRIARDGGWVLDGGAGRRGGRTRHVVRFGVVDDGTTDLLAVGEALPFADGSFDAALSLSTLAQVRDPLACATELLRVVKPGGEILAAVPAQPPTQGVATYFHAVAQTGLEALFASGGELLESVAPSAGHPWPAMQELLRATLGCLPDAARDALAALSVGEAAAMDLGDASARFGLPAAPLASSRHLIRIRRL